MKHIPADRQTGHFSCDLYFSKSERPDYNPSGPPVTYYQRKRLPKDTPTCVRYIQTVAFAGGITASSPRFQFIKRAVNIGMPLLLAKTLFECAMWRQTWPEVERITDETRQYLRRGVTYNQIHLKEGN